MTMAIRVEDGIEGGVRLGIEPCACGGCHPTATAYEGDPRYERHDPALSEGPCCCGRFFVLGETAERARERAEAIADRFRAAGSAPARYTFAPQTIRLPWGEEFAAVVADFAPDDEAQTDADRG